MAVVLSIIVYLVCGLDPPSESGPVASQPSDRRAVIRAAYERINQTPSYFSEMDAREFLLPASTDADRRE